MRAHVEWLTDKIGIIRGGYDFKEYGDDFEFSCTLVRHGPLGELKGMSGKLPLSAVKAIRDVLEAEAIFDVQWERRKNGATVFRGKHL